MHLRPRWEEYSKTLLHHVTPGVVGQTFHCKLVIEGDTMTLTGPTNPEDQKAVGTQLTEVYTRKD